MPNGISAYHLYLNKQLKLIGLNPFPPFQTFHTQLSSGNGDEDDDEDGDGEDGEGDEPSFKLELSLFYLQQTTLSLANYKH